MKIRRIVKPGQPGTKKLLEQFGDNLICVRYRYDEENQKMLKTVELIVENRSWTPNTAKIPMNKIVQLRINRDEIELRKRVKQAGGKWDAQNRVWHLPYQKARHLGLAERIVP